MIYYLGRAVRYALLCACIPSLLLTAQNDLANTTQTPARGTVSVGMQYLLGDGMTPPTVKPTSPSIAYPELALVQGIEGTLEVKVLVNEKGGVSEVAVVSSSDPIFVDPTLSDLKKFEFVPASVDGKATELWLRMDIGFKTQHSWTSAFDGEEQSQQSSSEWALVGDGEMPQFDQEILRDNIVFPKEAMARGAAGVVVVRARVSTEGEVVAMEVEGTADADLAEAAFQAVAATPFTPGTEAGEPKEMWTMIPITFTPSGSGSIVTGTQDEGVKATAAMEVPTYDLQELYGNFRYSGGALDGPVDVTLRVLIDRSGTVEQVLISDEKNGLVSKAAADAVKLTRFTPGTQNGEAIPVWITVEMRVSPK